MTAGEKEAYKRGYKEGKEQGQEDAERDHEVAISVAPGPTDTIRKQYCAGWELGYRDGFASVKKREPHGIPLCPGGMAGGRET